jgi:hypothetical protein
VLRRKKIRFTLLVAVAALLLAPATAGATTSSAITDQVAAAVSRIVNHQNSAADIALVKSRPEIARHVPAPDGISTFVNAKGFTLANGQKPSVGAVVQDENCAGAIDVGVQSVSILGNIIWRWIHHIEACSDNVNVTRFLTRRDQLTIADGTIEFLELATDVQGFTPSAWTTSTRQRHLRQCFPIVQCTNWYPWVRVQLFADHTYLWWWGSNQ